MKNLVLLVLLGWIVFALPTAALGQRISDIPANCDPTGRDILTEFDDLGAIIRASIQFDATVGENRLACRPGFYRISSTHCPDGIYSTSFGICYSCRTNRDWLAGFHCHRKANVAAGVAAWFVGNSGSSTSLRLLMDYLISTMPLQIDENY